MDLRREHISAHNTHLKISEEHKKEARILSIMRIEDSKLKGKVMETSSWSHVWQFLIHWGFHLCTQKSPPSTWPKHFSLHLMLLSHQPSAWKNSASQVPRSLGKPWGIRGLKPWQTAMEKMRSLTSPQASLIAQLVKNLSAMQETLIQFLGWEDPLETG